MRTPIDSPLRLARAAVDIERRLGDGIVLRSPDCLGPHAKLVDDWLSRWAMVAPGRTFLAERRGGEWEHVSYAKAAGLVPRIAEGLLQQGLGADAPLMVLSDNSIAHALLMLAAMHVGIPVAPISPAYSLLSQDHAKLRQIASLLRPGAVFAEDTARFAKALSALGRASIDFDQLQASFVSPKVAEAHAKVTPDTVAKVLFTSGSTGSPKGVITTQRMLTVNQQQSLQVWPFLGDEPPVVVDWLPWNHTFGGNFNFNLVLSNGGTMYIDAGKPVPALFGETLRNLRELAPTLYFNVPKGFDLLLPHLEQDTSLRRNFFSRCRFLFYAGAALPQNLWDRFQRMARAEAGTGVTLVSAWGATETAPLCVAAHFAIDQAGVVGLPVPGCDVKLVPNAGKLEARVRGPHVTPGYFRSPELTKSAFDEEGFYLIGDALRFLDPSRPEKGLVFDGRVSEDFKLRTGTWVHAGAMRTHLVAACDPWVQDAVITGHDRDEIGALLFLAPSAAAHPASDVRQQIALGLRRLADIHGNSSSTCVARALVQAVLPRADAGEITDKGYINQRTVLHLRAADVEYLHAHAAGDNVIFPASQEAAPTNKASE